MIISRLVPGNSWRSSGRRCPISLIRWWRRLQGDYHHYCDGYDDYEDYDDFDDYDYYKWPWSWWWWWQSSESLVSHSPTCASTTPTFSRWPFHQGQKEVKTFHTISVFSSSNPPKKCACWLSTLKFEMISNILNVAYKTNQLTIHWKVIKTCTWPNWQFSYCVYCQQWRVI